MWNEIELRVFGTIFGILDMFLVLWVYKIYTESKQIKHRKQ